ncbi:MAG: SRPBCC domain-containing protein [Phycisphaeraceae bacterium]|nr:SRPBCC domain-containing protein [Phycisphaeraceae bacterium]
MVRLENDGVWVTLKETIAAHHEEVFACLTTEAGLIRWFPVACQVELRTGGQMKLAFDAKFRRPLTIPILEYHEDGRVSWGWYPGIGDEMVPIHWTVTPEVEQGARVIHRHGPFRNDTEHLIELANDAESWRWYMCNLRTVLEARVDMRHERPL